MSKRTTVSLLAAMGMVLLVAAGVALAQAPEGGDQGKEETNATDTDGGKTLDLESRPTSIDNTVDVGNDGATPGDTYVFTDELFDRQNPSERLGQADGRCTLMDPEAGRYGCTIISTFEDGTITTEGILTNEEGANNVASVTGGTGAYRGMTGEETFELGGPGNPDNIQFTLQPISATSQPTDTSQLSANAQPNQSNQAREKQESQDKQQGKNKQQDKNKQQEKGDQKGKGKQKAQEATEQTTETTEQTTEEARDQ